MKTIEVSIKDFAVAVSRRWLPIIIVGVIFAGVVGIFDSIRLPDYVKSIETEITEISTEISTEINNLKSKQDEANNVATAHDLAYSKIALLSFSIDMNNENVQAVDSSLTVGIIDLKPDLIDRIVDYYIVLAERASLESILKDLPFSNHLPEETLRMIIKINKEDKANGIITIESTGFNGVEGNLIVETVYNYMVGMNRIVSASTGEHILNILNQQSINLMPQWAKDAKNGYIVTAAGYGEQITELQNKYGEQITELQNKVSNKESSLVIYFLIGIVVAILAVIIIYIVRLNVLLPDQIQRQLGLKLIGGVKRKQGILSAGLGNILAGNLLHKKETEAIEFISVNIEESIGEYEYKNILLTGTLPEEIISDFARKLIEKNENSEISFSCGGDVNCIADTVGKLASAECVVLVERINVSKLREVNREKERIENCGKTIIGYVLF